MRFLGIVTLLGMAACGASSAEVKRAKSVAYNTEFTTVWKATFDEVGVRYDGKIVLAKPDQGVIVSDWKLVEANRDSEQGTSRSAVENIKTVGGVFFRHIVRVVGGPPWRVVVDGEAANYTPGMAVLQPYPHGAPDEPGWVNGRIDDLSLSVYERLKAFAVDAPPGSETADKLPPIPGVPGAAPATGIAVPPNRATPLPGTPNN